MSLLLFGPQTQAGDAAVVFLDTPTNLVATATGTYSINLTWDAVGSASYYLIERDGTIIEDYWLTTSYDDLGLTEDTPYSYRVKGMP